MCFNSVVPDAIGLLMRVQRVYTSDDRGQTWQYRHTVSEALAYIKIPRPNGDMLVVSNPTL